jgi:hypothetical protein
MYSTKKEFENLPLCVSYFFQSLMGPGKVMAWGMKTLTKGLLQVKV